MRPAVAAAFALTSWMVSLPSGAESLEARVLNLPKDEHWIKLDHESQREGSRLVTFGPVNTR